MRCAGIGTVLALFACVLTTAATARTLAAPTVTSFAPKSGAIGTKVTIVGKNLTGASVTFNGAEAPDVAVNKWGTALVATVPYDSESLTAGTSVQIEVTTREGTATPASAFAVTATTKLKPSSPTVAKPRLGSFMPMAGKPGATVTIRGSGFGGALAVKFGGVKAIFKVPSQTKILATVPLHAKTGKLSVRTSGGVGTSAGRFTVLPGAHT
jgi:hypothetical protein